MNPSKQEYQKMAKKASPGSPFLKNALMAFLFGGAICCLGQGLVNLYMYWGLELKDARAFVSISLIGISAILTAFKVYDNIAKTAGAGTLVPITGFANSVAAPAIEFKSEGQVFGVGCKIFTIAGPVILYGIFTSWVLGLGYWVLKMLGVA